MGRAEEVSFIGRKGLKKDEANKPKVDWSFQIYCPCKARIGDRLGKELVS
jgi:hypothetical protein